MKISEQMNEYWKVGNRSQRALVTAYYILLAAAILSFLLWVAGYLQRMTMYYFVFVAYGIAWIIKGVLMVRHGNSMGRTMAWIGIILIILPNILYLLSFL